MDPGLGRTWLARAPRDGDAGASRSDARRSEDEHGAGAGRSGDARHSPATLLTALQRTAGNRAVALWLQRGGGGTTAAPPQPAPSPRQALDRGLREGTAAAITPLTMPDLQRASDAERITLIEALIRRHLNPREAEAVRRIWASFRPNLTRAAVEHSDLWDRCNARGARIPNSWLGSAGGTRRITQTEQVGGWEYVVRGAYDFRVLVDRVEIRVPINFVPDRGVTVPTATWLGHIRSTWNHFSAVDSADPTRRKRIEFIPSVGGNYHRVRVAAGGGRANAALFYAGDSDAANTIPHEFGHLIGLEDEYERDAADFRRVTGQAPQAGDPARRQRAQQIARDLRAALFQSEGLLEWHTTATGRRRTAVNRVFNTARLPRNYSTPLTRQVATAYRALYRSELTRDIVRQIDRVADDTGFRDWREGVVGVFQFTSGSIMGAPGYQAAPGAAAHDHGAQPRHVRAFAQHVQNALGGRWRPERTH
jgi:hypothetical protein